jgi:hypothetical protein
MKRMSILMYVKLVMILICFLKVDCIWCEDSLHPTILIDSSTKYDLSSSKTIIMTYLRALESNDREALIRLIPPGFEAIQEINEQLEKYGGASVERATIKITNNLSPEVASVKISTFGVDGQPLVIVKNIFWSGSSWLLCLGSVPNLRPSSDTSYPKNFPNRKLKKSVLINP